MLCRIDSPSRRGQNQHVSPTIDLATIAQSGSQGQRSERRLVQRPALLRRVRTSRNARRNYVIRFDPSSETAPIYAAPTKGMTGIPTKHATAL